jgi:uncharacterized protein (TIGR04222 family)
MLLGAALVCAVLLVVWSILGVIAVSRMVRGDPDAPERPTGLIVACALSIPVSFYFWAAVGQPLERNRRGDHVLDEARARYSDLIPSGRPWQALWPEELALSVALFGLKGWAALPPLSQLHAALQPPQAEPSSPV